MDTLEEGVSTHEIIKGKLRQNFDGKIVRKDLTKKITLYLNYYNGYGVQLLGTTKK